MKRQAQHLEPESTGSRPRQPQSPLPTPPHTPFTQRSGARTLHACEPCRERRAKCDGRSPDCGRCKQRQLHCYYADGRRERQKKEHRRLAARASLYEGLLQESLQYFDPVRRQAIHDGVIRSTTEFDHDPSYQSELGENTIQGWLREEPMARGNTGFPRSEDHIQRDERGSPQPERFPGKASIVGWLEDAGKELFQKRTSSPCKRSMSDAASSSSSDVSATRDDLINLFLKEATYYDNSLDLSKFGESGELICETGLPPRETADALLECYFQTVHLVYPIVLKPVFIYQYDTFWTSSRLPDSGSIWLAMLNIMLAIGIVGMQAVQPHYLMAADHHIVYFMRARLLHPDPTSTVAVPSLEHIQLSFLTGVYLAATCQIDRAFHVVGSSVRFAQSLAFHRIDDSPGTSGWRRELGIRLWHSICGLDVFLSFLTGHPPAFDYHTANTPMPMPIEEDLASGPSQRNPSSEPRIGQFSSVFTLQSGILLDKILADTMQLLYGVSTIKLTRAEAQRHVSQLNLRLENWRSDMPPSYTFGQDPGVDNSSLPERMYLVLRYFSISMIINRPYLCGPKLQSTVANQPNATIGADKRAAELCVASARATLRLFPNDPDIIWLFQSTPWWCVLHFIVQAGTVLVLEILHDTMHTTGIFSNLLTDARKVLRWLSMLAENGVPAKRAWVVLSLLLSLSTNEDDFAELEAFMAPEVLYTEKPVPSATSS